MRRACLLGGVFRLAAAGGIAMGAMDTSLWHLLNFGAFPWLWPQQLTGLGGSGVCTGSLSVVTLHDGVP